VVRISPVRGTSASVLRDHRRPSVPGSLSVLVLAATVVALPVVAQRFDASADEFTGSHFPVGVAVGWVVCALLTAVVITRRVQIWIHVEEGSVLALTYDALPILLVGAWIVAVAALVSDHRLLATVAIGLCLHHLVLVIPRLASARVPRWAHDAPAIDVVVANVYIDNATPAEAARQLVEVAADLVVIVESTPAFMQVFDEEGGAEAYPHRVFDPDDDSDYAVTLATRRELGPRSLMTRLGPLRLAIADIDVDGTSTLVVALNPMATVDPGGHVTWKEQIEVLTSFVPSLTGPVMIAGDMNTTRYRPEFEQLLALGLSDAIDALGRGLSPSFKLGAGGVLGAIGPVARLDHALVNDAIHPLELENLESCGSDHVPFRLRVAIRPDASHRHRHRHRRAKRGQRTHVTPENSADTSDSTID
jgi:endonuclease/exonuclease/phosphatase (EEP) superfamily protein YafD